MLADGTTLSGPVPGPRAAEGNSMGGRSGGSGEARMPPGPRTAGGGGCGDGWAGAGLETEAASGTCTSGSDHDRGNA